MISWEGGRKHAEISYFQKFHQKNSRFQQPKSECSQEVCQSRASPWPYFLSYRKLIKYLTEGGLQMHFLPVPLKGSSVTAYSHCPPPAISLQKVNPRSTKSPLVLLSYFMHKQHILGCTPTSKSVAFFIPAAEVLSLSALKILENSISFPFFCPCNKFSAVPQNRWCHLINSSYNSINQQWVCKYLDIQEWTCLELQCNGEADGSPGKKKKTDECLWDHSSGKAHHGFDTFQVPTAALWQCTTGYGMNEWMGKWPALRDFKWGYLAQAE